MELVNYIIAVFNQCFIKRVKINFVSQMYKYDAEEYRKWLIYVSNFETLRIHNHCNTNIYFCCGLTLSLSRRGGGGRERERESKHSKTPSMSGV
jgi:hypothetical protein